MRDPRKVRAWHLARRLSVEVVEAFPETVGRRVPGLRSQAIRAAMSIPANISEGCGRDSRHEFVRYLEIAIGSLNELDAHLIAALDTSIIAPAKYASFQTDIIVLRRMLLSLRTAVQQQIVTAEVSTHAVSKRRR